MPHQVAILAYDRLCTFEFGCAVELFALHRPELGVDWYAHKVCAVDPSPMRAMGGVRITAKHGLPTLRRADTIVVPGWRDTHEKPPEALLAALRAAHKRGARIASICSGVFVLAHAGLLSGQRVATHWRYAELLGSTFPDVQVDASSLYVDAGKIITSAGSAAGLDMLLHLVRNDFGAAVANSVAQRLVMPPHRDGGQAQFVPRPMPNDGVSVVARLMDWVRSNLRLEHTLASMAKHVAMSERTLQRQFKAATGTTPQAWLIRERIALAKDILEANPMQRIDVVADLAGFGSAESMRRHFRLHRIAAPTRYRQQFGLARPSLTGHHAAGSIG
jgi:AraC family transcriptional regulator, transcriptional activator FtrA